MFWYDWILLIVNIIISCIIGNILGELTINWYKKRKKKMTKFDKLTLDCLLMDMEKIMKCSNCKLCEEHDYNKCPTIDIDWNSIQWNDNKE